METKKLGEEKKYIYVHNKGEKFVMKRLWRRVTKRRGGRHWRRGWSRGGIDKRGGVDKGGG